MLDTVINGTRTSRSILGNLSIPDDPAEAIALLKSSGWLIDLGPLNDAGLSQRGTDLNKANLLSDETAALYGELPENPTVDNAFALISDMFYRASSGKAKITVTVKLADGTPVPDAYISPLVTQTGGPVFTEPDGKAVGYVDAGSRTISVSNMLDITSDTQTVSAATGKSYAVSLTAQTRNYVEFTSSSNGVYISGLAKRVDASMGGAGGGGGYKTGGGGGGGRTNTKENVLFETRKLYPVMVGAAGRYGGYINGTYLSAVSGGTSSFLGLSASGGSAGSSGSAFSSGGSGNGTGGNGGNNSQAGSLGTDGNGSVFSSFSEEIPWGGGGGGGGAGNSFIQGGSPGGGLGGCYNINGLDGASGGGGGGGGTGSPGNGGTGSPGKVAARIWFEEDLAA